MIDEYMMKSTSIVSTVILEVLSKPSMVEDVAKMCNDFE